MATQVISWCERTKNNLSSGCTEGALGRLSAKAKPRQNRARVIAADELDVKRRS
jgi:hypothetical protein